MFHLIVDEVEDVVKHEEDINRQVGQQVIQGLLPGEVVCRVEGSPEEQGDEALSGEDYFFIYIQVLAEQGNRMFK